MKKSRTTGISAKAMDFKLEFDGGVDSPEGPLPLSGKDVTWIIVPVAPSLGASDMPLGKEYSHSIIEQDPFITSPSNAFVMFNMCVKFATGLEQSANELYGVQVQLPVGQEGTTCESSTPPFMPA